MLSLTSCTGRFFFFAMMGGGGRREEVKSCPTRDRSDSQPTFVTAVTECLPCPAGMSHHVCHMQL